MAAMKSHVIAIALAMQSLVGASDVHPDWDKLTNFKTSVAFDFAAIIAFGKTQMVRSHTLEELPVSSVKGAGTIQLDVLGERFKMASAGQATFSESSSLPPPLRGALTTCNGSITFDAKAGFVLYKGKFSTTSTKGPASFELCAKVNFPQGLLPSGTLIMSELDRSKPHILGVLNKMPHTDVTVDGSKVALYERPGDKECLKFNEVCGPPEYCKGKDGDCLKFGDQKISPDAFAGIMHDATPVGAGMQGPVNGKWDSAIVKFSDWTKGAGAIEEGSCVTLTATELLRSHHATHSLWAFDQLMNQLKSTEPLSSALAFIPAKPSEIFASAAKLESINVGAVNFDEDAKMNVPSQSAWFTVAMAAIGGVVGAGVVLAFSKGSRTPVGEYAFMA